MHSEPKVFELRDAGPPEVLSPKAVRLGCGCLGLLVLALLFMTVVRPYTDWLWFSHDARQPEVFTTAYATKAKLFVGVLVVCTLALYWSLAKALQVTMVYLRRPSTPGEQLISNAFGIVQIYGPTVVKVASLVLGLLFAAGFQNEWNTFLAYRNATPFGIDDPLFGHDLGFFVFELPWWLAVSNLLYSFLLVLTALTVGIYVGLQVMASMARIELSRPFVRMHLCVIGGATVLALSWQLWLRRYEAGLVDSFQFTGAGFAGVQRLGAQTVVAILLALLGLGIILNGRLGKPFKFTLYGAGAVFAAYLLGVVAYPVALQRLRVEPNKLQMESPYAKRAIAMTRWAYGLDAISVRDIEAKPRPSADEVAAAQATLDNIRLWDPDILRQTLDGIQSLKGYYTFHDVDVDRYVIDGQRRTVMLAARDVDHAGLDPQAQTWVNTRLGYTHGFGLVLAPVNAVSSTGLPALAIRDIPPKTSPGLPVTEPRLYFSDQRDELQRTVDSYALVSTGADEFDYPGANNEAKGHRWTGDRGVPVGGWLARLAYSLVLGDGNLLVSSNISSDTRLLYRRNVLDRAELIYPFLKFDSDPYVVLLNGRLIWVIDAYTTASRIPYSARTEGGATALNYIRNSVKITVDAYSGETTAYAILPDEPVLRTYRKIYPGLVKDASQIPAGLREHFRYPEDLLHLQALQFCQYHVTDPYAFLQNQDAWDIAHERDLNGNRGFIRPYYVLMKLPDEDRESFVLILPFTPRQKTVMSGWLSAHCDPETYGQLVLYRYQGQNLENIPGPEQMENRFNTDPKIADINRQFTNDQSEIVTGNLLVIPVGQSVMYVEPLFLKSRSPGMKAIPELKKVILAFSDRIVVGDTFQEALKDLLGGQPPQHPSGASDTKPSPPKPDQPANTELRQGYQEVLSLLDEADAALRAGDFARFGDLQKRAKARLKELAGR
jgi:uncharacterized membrane protein (UPF0182 family)